MNMNLNRWSSATVIMSPMQEVAGGGRTVGNADGSSKELQQCIIQQVDIYMKPLL